MSHGVIAIMVGSLRTSVYDTVGLTASRLR